MKEPINPISPRGIAAFLGTNLAFGSLLSWVADLIQVITFTHGLLMFGVIFLTSSVVFGLQIYKYHSTKFRELEKALQSEKLHREDLQKRLARLIIEFRSRSSINPRPMVVNAYICTRKLETRLTDIRVAEITPKLIVINKGGEHGLAYGMSFAVFSRRGNQHLENCTIDRIEPGISWLQHSGKTIKQQLQPEDLIVQITSPSDVQDFERELAEMILIAEGFDRTPHPIHEETLR